MTDILKRTTVMVRDAEASARWYEAVFGMTRWMDTPFTLSGTQLAAGAKGDQTRLVIMKAEHDVVGMIGLLQWLDPPMPAPTDLPRQVNFGAPTPRSAIGASPKTASKFSACSRWQTSTWSDDKSPNPQDSCAQNPGMPRKSPKYHLKKAVNRSHAAKSARHAPHVNKSATCSELP